MVGAHSQTESGCCCVVRGGCPTRDCALSEVTADACTSGCGCGAVVAAAEDAGGAAAAAAAAAALPATALAEAAAAATRLWATRDVPWGDAAGTVAAMAGVATAGEGGGAAVGGGGGGIREGCR